MVRLFMRQPFIRQLLCCVNVIVSFFILLAIVLSVLWGFLSTLVSSNYYLMNMSFWIESFPASFHGRVQEEALTWWTKTETIYKIRPLRHHWVHYIISRQCFFFDEYIFCITSCHNSHYKTIQYRNPMGLNLLACLDIKSSLHQHE